MTALLAVAALAALPVGSLCAAGHFVARGGRADNPGTADAPWNIDFGVLE